MKIKHHWILFIILIFFILFCVGCTITESYRGYYSHGGRGYGRRGGYYGRGGLYKRRDIYPPRRQFRSYGPYYGYNNYNVPLIAPIVNVPVVRQVEYTNPWYTGWFGGYGTCKSGCTNVGKGKWGCQYPGTGVHDCQFSDDCNWCGNSWWY
jgi:hypothetical protein